MTTKQFLLPDLGEGLPDATIVEWYVKVGDTIKLDDNLVSMETAKAVVDVPSPVSGKVLKLAGGAGDVIVTGTMLAEFEIDPSMPQRAEGQDTGHHHGPSKGTGAHASRHGQGRRVRRRRRDQRQGRRARRPKRRAKTAAPSSARCSPPMRCAAKPRSRSAASRRCRRCVRWRASSASTSRACARPGPTASSR